MKEIAQMKQRVIKAIKGCYKVKIDEKLIDNAIKLCGCKFGLIMLEIKDSIDDELRKNILVGGYKYGKKV